MILTRRPLLLLVLATACGSHDEPATDTARVSATARSREPAPILPDTVMQSSSSSRWVVTPTSFGPVLAGMSLPALGSALGERVRASYNAGSRCTYVRPAALPMGVLVMVQGDTVARVDIRAVGVRTAEGAGVGDTESSVLARYAGRVRAAPHKYTGPEGHNLIVSAPPDTTHLIIFETDGRTVTSYRAGRRPAVELVEGCA